MSALVTPILHLNGDRPEVLLARLEEAFRAVRTAIEAVRQCAPNGRNFYPDPGRLARAQAQHDERLVRLWAVEQSISQEAMAIQRDRN